VGAFLADYPAVQFWLHSGNTSEIVELLLNRKVAIGLIEGPSRDRGIRCEPFMEDELVLITPRQFELEHLSGNQLLASRLLMREQGSGSRRVVETTLEKAGFKLKSFRRVIDLDSTEAIKSAVEAGLGIGFVSRWAISKELELSTLRVAPVSGAKIMRHFALVTRTGRNPMAQPAHCASSRSAEPASSPTRCASPARQAIPADKLC